MTDLSTQRDYSHGLNGAEDAGLSGGDTPSVFQALTVPSQEGLEGTLVEDRAPCRLVKTPCEGKAERVRVADGESYRNPENALCQPVRRVSHDPAKLESPRLGVASRLHIEEALVLARRVVRMNLRRVEVPRTGEKLQILTAGRGHFKALWTRDACFAALGIIESNGDLTIVRDTLKAIFCAMLPDGTLPVRQGDRSNRALLVLEFFGRKTPECSRLTMAKYRNGRGVDQIDCNILPLIVAARYLEQCGDREFFDEFREALGRSGEWICARMRNGLIEQGASGDWKDMVGRRGAVTYTNVLGYEALQQIGRLFTRFGDDERGATFQRAALDIRAHLRSKLWDERRGYFRNSLEEGHFSVDGNVLALLFGLADGRQAHSICRKLEVLLREEWLPFRALDGEYPAPYVPLYLKLYGLRHYHDACVWPWLGSLAAIAAATVGERRLAETIVSRISLQAARDSSFYEIYRGGLFPKPVHTWAYHSEPGFLWSAGLYLWAAKVVLERLPR